MVDQKQISFKSAVELSYLAPEEQEFSCRLWIEVQASLLFPSASA